MEYSRALACASRATRRLLQEARALLFVGAVYWLWLQPLARRELALWGQRARVIPDRSLRECALSKLADEALNPEAAALFAVLAPNSERRRIVAFIVAYQVLYDYLDAVNERPGCTEIRTGLQLHLALTEALKSSREHSKVFLRHGDHGDDGGYVEALVTTCRDALGEVSPAASKLLVSAGLRCARAQSHNHAYVAHASESLVRWSRTQHARATAYEWWEIAAAGISCLGVHALVASAARPQSSDCQLSHVDRAYYPSVCALSALLDSLADFHEDAGSENHSFVAHYRDDAHTAGRLVAIAAEANALIGALPHAARHKVILVGICSYYLSCSSVLAGFPALARQALLGHVGWLGRPMLAAMSARRRLQPPPAVANRAASRAHATRGEVEPRMPQDQGSRAQASSPRRSSQSAQDPAKQRA
jgi:tetraprenyl-beta-curcumene synthase